MRVGTSRLPPLRAERLMIVQNRYPGAADRSDPRASCRTGQLEIEVFVRCAGIVLDDRYVENAHILVFRNNEASCADRRIIDAGLSCSRNRAPLDGYVAAEIVAALNANHCMRRMLADDDIRLLQRYAAGSRQGLLLYDSRRCRFIGGRWSRRLWSRGHLRRWLRLRGYRRWRPLGGDGRAGRCVRERRGRER